MNLKLASALALIVGGAIAATPHTSSAADVKMDVVITNGITILYYDSALTVTVDASTLATTLTGCTTAAGIVNCNSGAAAATATASVTGLTATMPPVVVTPLPGGVSAAAMPLLLQNVWAVRALGGTSANTTVTATVGTNTTLSNGTASMKLNPSIGIGTTATPTLGASPAAISFPDPGLANTVTGSVILSLDMTLATIAGTYTAAGGQQYTIAVTAT